MALGFSRILEHPQVYTLAQRILGGVQARVWALDELRPRTGEALLDVGCGPAYYVGDLPRLDYVGFDTDAGYIRHARSRFGDRGRFFDEPFTEERRRELPAFDAVMLMGLLHHVSDEDATSLLALIARSLKPEGRVVSLDTVFHDGQSRLARILAENDRGLFVRRPEGFASLAAAHFESIEGRVVGDSFKCPTSHYLMVMKRPLIATRETAQA
jgi:SAM-dependent methyltransferase